MATKRSALPSLERKPGGPDNWVERVGGLPQYIDRIARHLHYDKGMDIGHAIATAVNTVKRWARKGTVVKYNDPKTNHVTTITAAQAAADVAAWEAKKAAARGTSARAKRSGRLSPRSVKLSEVSVDVLDLAQRANSIADPEVRAGALLQVVDLALTKDGRKSFKRQGKWGHGFVPLDAAAKRAKAKGSAIAEKRMERLYGSPSKAAIASKVATKRTLAQRKKDGPSKGEKPENKRGATLKIQSTSGGRKGHATQQVKTAGQAMNADIRDSTVNQRAKIKNVEVGRGRRSASRATKSWSQIADADKTVRNGKRYVVVNFNGQNLITEWVGENPQNEPKDVTARARPSMTTQDINNLTTAQMRKMLKQANLAPDVRKRIAKALKNKAAKARKQEK